MTYSISQKGSKICSATATSTGTLFAGVDPGEAGGGLIHVDIRGIMFICIIQMAT